MNKKTNAPTEQKNVQKKVQKIQTKRTEINNTLETERSNKKRADVDNTLETEQSNKRSKTASDQLVEGKYFIHIIPF